MVSRGVNGQQTNGIFLTNCNNRWFLTFNLSLLYSGFPSANLPLCQIEDHDLLPDFG